MDSCRTLPCVGLATRLKSVFSGTDNSTTQRSPSSWGDPTNGQSRRRSGGYTLFRDTENSAQRKTSVSRDNNQFHLEAQRPSTITLTNLEDVFRQEPLLKRGVIKHSADLVREWFTLRDPDGEDEHGQNEAFQEWARDQRLKRKLNQLIASAHIYGDGFLERAWSDENGNDPEIGMQEVPESAQLEHIFIVDPFNLNLRTPEGDDSTAFAIEDRQAGQQDLILHPDRYSQLKLFDLPGYLHGVATSEAAYHSAHSKVQGDQASGEILFHCGVPFTHVQIDGADDDETDAVTGMLNSDEVIRGYASDETHTVESVNPGSVNPAPFYDHFVESIAAAVGMPKAKLRGAQAGTLAGSKMNERDYHEELSGLQETVLSELIQDLVQGRLGLDPSEYEVDWHSFDISPEVQASVDRDRARAFTDLVNGGVNPQAAAEEVGFELEEEAFREIVPSQQAATIPPGGGV